MDDDDDDDDDDSSYSSISHCSSFHLLTLVLSTILHPLRRLFAIIVVVVAIIGIEFERDVMVTMTISDDDERDDDVNKWDDGDEPSKLLDIEM